MKISLFQGILFAIFGVGALIGLFVFATHTGTTKNTSTATAGPVVIWGTLPKAGIQNTLTALTQNDSTLKDVSYVQKDQATLPDDLASAIATGNTPDLVLASQEELPSLAKFIQPIPSATLPASSFENTFIQEGRLFAVPNGAGYYGVPFLVDPLVLFSNNAILSSNGIARPPATWEALTGLVPNIALVTPSKQISRSLIALGTYDNVHNARAILSALFLQTGVPLSVYSNNALVASLNSSSSGAADPGQAVLNFYTQFADPSKVSYTWNASLPNSQQAFLAGDLALYIGFASEAPFLMTANPNLNFTVTPLPQPATANVKSTYGLVYAFMIPNGAKNAAGAYQAAAVLSAPADQTAAAALTGLTPATLNPLATAPTDPIAAVAYAEALYASGWLSPAPSSTDQVFSSMIGGVISGRLESNMALTSSESALTSLLQK